MDVGFVMSFSTQIIEKLFDTSTVEQAEKN